MNNLTVYMYIMNIVNCMYMYTPTPPPKIGHGHIIRIFLYMYMYVIASCTLYSGFDGQTTKMICGR